MEWITKVSKNHKGYINCYQKLFCDKQQVHTHSHTHTPVPDSNSWHIVQVGGYKVMAVASYPRKDPKSKELVFMPMEGNTGAHPDIVICHEVDSPTHLTSQRC